MMEAAGTKADLSTAQRLGSKALSTNRLLDGSSVLRLRMKEEEATSTATATGWPGWPGSL